MHAPTRSVALLGLLTLSVACAEIPPLPTRPASLQLETPGARYFVVRHEKDERDLASIVVEALRERGIEARAGSLAEATPDVDFILTYSDRWSWDMRMFLALFRLEVRSPHFRELHFVESAQSSLAALGKKYEAIVERSVDELFDGPAPKAQPQRRRRRR